MSCQTLKIALILSLLASVSRGFVVPRSCVTFQGVAQCHQPQATSSTTTCLQMGVRDFIKKRILKRSADEKTEEPKKVDKAASAKAEALVAAEKAKAEKAKVVSAKPKQEAKKRPTTSNGEENDLEFIPQSVLDRQPETTQDKINRVKTGKMTDEEKQAFLRTALTSTESHREPLRQPLLSQDGVGPKRGGASPFPKDSILRNIIGSKKTKDGETVDWSQATKLVTDEQKKKREYLDMVTDPNRFHAYKADPSTTSSSRASSPPPIPLMMQRSEPSAAAEDASTSTSEINVPEDLGARLGVAAMEDVKRQKEQEKERNRQLEEARLDEERRIADVKRQREDEQARLEAEAMARKMEQEEAERRRLEEERRKEQARLKELQARQDAYWEKKLATEKAQREGTTTTVASEKAEGLPDATAKESSEPEPVTEEVPTEEPYLKNARKATTEPMFTPTDFFEEQELKHMEIDRVKHDQLAKLKALSSPLPSGPPAGLSPAIAMPPAQAPKYEPAPVPEDEIPDLASKTIGEAAAEVKPESEKKQDGGGGGGLGAFSRLLGGNGGGSVADAPKKASPAPPSTKKRVVRQQLPLGDDEDAEFDKFARGGPNKNMSIADAMKSSGEEPAISQDDRSRKWGVDMDRISKSLEKEQQRDN